MLCQSTKQNDITSQKTSLNSDYHWNLTSHISLVFCVCVCVYFFLYHYEPSCIFFADRFCVPETSYRHQSRNTIPLSNSDSLQCSQSAIHPCSDPHESITDLPHSLPPLFFLPCLHFNTLICVYSSKSLSSIFTNQQCVYALLRFLMCPVCQDCCTVLVFIILIKLSEGGKLSSA